MCFLVLIVPATGGAVAPKVERRVIASKILGEDRPLNIVLPANYAPDKAYPVVYALDGDARHIPLVAEGMQAAHAELIVVGVENVDRSRDMFPDPLPARRNQGGGGARFLEFLTTELIPYVESKFAVNGYRVISGQSNSGFFVLYAMLHAPNVFDAYLASSPMVGWDWEMIRVESTDLLTSSPSFPKSLFMNQGETDLDQVTEYLPAYVKLLREISPADFRWKNEMVEGSGHVPDNSYTNGIAFIFDGR
jgi:predicted alpha/beta superfamily hydrolase